VRTIRGIDELQKYLGERSRQESVGLVPTMGALHRGHGSLIDRARQETDTVIVSIFVNPLQFAPTEDLQQYPRSWENDSLFCQELGVDAIFIPSATEMGVSSDAGSENSETTLVIPPKAMMSGLCGKFRPGHFQGVATIVTKLLNIVRPNIAYFGEKDAQQLAIVRRVVADLNLPVEIRSCPTVREPSGLALSSRNQYMNPAEKEIAATLYRSLDRAKIAFTKGERNCQILKSIVFEELTATQGIEIQYIEIVHPQTLESLETIDDIGLLALACYVGSTRSIDSVVLRSNDNSMS
jgi:pantoate ligase / CMP/dCMP kinase